MQRVVAGTLRGRRLLELPRSITGVRPSSSRVRSAIFDRLQAEVVGARVLDLFAGTGALGFELASRGAAQVTLVERNPALAAKLLRTREKLSAAMVEVVTGEALAFARAAPARSFDVVFLDPPFGSDLLPQALNEAARIVVDGGFVYAESGAPLDAATAEVSGLQTVRQGRAGQVHFHLLQKA